jgi:hypothetical protein
MATSKEGLSSMELVNAAQLTSLCVHNVPFTADCRKLQGVRMGWPLMAQPSFIFRENQSSGLSVTLTLRFGRGSWFPYLVPGSRLAYNDWICVPDLKFKSFLYSYNGTWFQRKSFAVIVVGYNTSERNACSGLSSDSVSVYPIQRRLVGWLRNDLEDSSGRRLAILAFACRAWEMLEQSMSQQIIEPRISRIQV